MNNNTLNPVTENTTKKDKVRKLDLGRIAEIMMTDTNGFISKDLYDALKLAEKAGLCEDGKELPEELVYFIEDRVLDYEADKLSKEADLVLLLRTKAGDKNALEKLYFNKLPLIKQLIHKISSTFIKSNTSLEKDFEYFEQEAFITFYDFVICHPVVYSGKVLFSHTSIDVYLRDRVKPILHTDILNSRTNFMTAKRIKKQLDAQNINIASMSFEEYQEYCREKGIDTNVTSGMYKSVKKYCNDDSFQNDDSVCDINEIPDYDNIPDNMSFEMSEFIKLISELRNDKKHGKDVEILLACELGEKDFNFSNMFAEHVNDQTKILDAAKMMGIDNYTDVTNAIKRAKYFIKTTIQKKYPEMYAEITRERGKAV